jgi:hypothetical protein
MAVVTISSDLLSDVPVGKKNNSANRAGASLTGNRFNVAALTQAADIGSTFRLCTLPANGRYLAGLSKLGYTAGGAGALFSMGYASYRGAYGEVVPAHPTFFGTGLDIAAAGRAFLDTLTASVDEFEAPTDLVLTLTVAGANLPVGFSCGGTIVFGAAFMGLP